MKREENMRKPLEEAAAIAKALEPLGSEQIPHRAAELFFIRRKPCKRKNT
jgi:hypothetical protein